MIRVLEETHRILNDHFIFKADKFRDFFGNPRAYDVEIYFFEVHLKKGIVNYINSARQLSDAPFYRTRVEISWTLTTSTLYLRSDDPGQQKCL